MPVIDSRHRIIFEDPKPERVCQWYACPLAASGYIGRKMKQCVKCTFVRYCSKDCQRHDWQSHKRYCKIPPIMDLGEWMEKNEWIFQWASLEALDVHNNRSKIHHNCLLVEVIRCDWLNGGGLAGPSPFCVEFARVMSIPQAQMLLPYLPIVNQMKKSWDIASKGGIGQATIIFRCAPRSKAGPEISMWHRHSLLGQERLKDHRQFVYWEGVLKAVVHGDLTVDDILRAIEHSSESSEEELQSSLDAMGI